MADAMKRVLILTALLVGVGILAITIFVLWTRARNGFEIKSYSQREDPTHKFVEPVDGDYEYDFVILHGNQEIRGRCYSSDRCQELAEKVGTVVLAEGTGSSLKAHMKLNDSGFLVYYPDYLNSRESRMEMIEITERRSR